MLRSFTNKLSTIEMSVCNQNMLFGKSKK